MTDRLLDPTSMAADLAAMLVRQEIRDVTLRYARGIDRGDFDLVRGCYHPDARDDHGVVNGSVDDFIAWASAQLPVFASTSHVLGNQLIELAGDTAQVETYVIAHHRLPGDATGPLRDFVNGGRYLDRFERRGGPWLIAHRRFVFDWERTDPVDDRYAYPLPDTCLRGSRGPADPLYTDIA